VHRILRHHASAKLAHPPRVSLGPASRSQQCRQQKSRRRQARILRLRHGGAQGFCPAAPEGPQEARGDHRNGPRVGVRQRRRGLLREAPCRRERHHRHRSLRRVQVSHPLRRPDPRLLCPGLHRRQERPPPRRLSPLLHCRREEGPRKRRPRQG